MHLSRYIAHQVMSRNKLKVFVIAGDFVKCMNIL